MAGEIWTLPNIRRAGTGTRAGTLAPRLAGLSQNLRTHLFYFLSSDMAQSHHINMDQASQVSPQGVSQDPGRWIGRVIVGVLVAEGIWGVLLALTRDLIVPFLSRLMGVDAQSAVPLGKGDFSGASIFTAVMQLCLAGLVAVMVNVWVSRPPRARRRAATKSGSSMSVVPPAIPTAMPAPVSATPINAAPMTPAKAPVAPQVVSSTPPAPKQTPTPAPPAAQPTKPRPPKEVRYNIVGEPISPMEDDE